MSDKTNIFNIPANYHFLESLFFWLEKNFGENLAQIKIFLPNRRSCRQFSQIFLNKKSQSFLPKIKAISDISFEDFFDFLPNEEAKEIINELLQIKSLSGIDYLIFLSQEIQKLEVFGKDLEFEQAFKIATNLQNLFEDIEREEIDLSQIDEIDDSNLSKHRQLTLDFLKNFHVQIKNSLLKKNIFFGTTTQNFTIQKFSCLIEKYGSKVPIILAGSSGSVLFSRKLIKSVADKNFVILHGLKETEDVEQNHPQFFLKSLINFLKIEEKSVVKIAEEKFCLSSQSRQNLISLMMLPFEQTLKWQEISKHLDVAKIALDLNENFKLIEAKNQIEEAKIISLILLENWQNKKSGALIINDEVLANLVSLELKSFDLPFNDTRNLSIFNSKLVNFLLLILELIQSDFNSHNLLALLKHPLCRHYKNTKILAEFEIKILRQDRASFDFKGIEKKLELLNQSNLQIFFSDVCGDILSFSKINNLAKLTSNLIETIEKLTQKTWQELLENEPAQIELFEFFEKIKSQNQITVNPKNILTTFKTLLSQISYFEKSISNAPIQILSSVEARLLNYDLVIISSLNEGDFPQIESENWLGKKIKKDLGIDRSAKKIGQNAFDFCNYLSSNSVVLTRHKNRSGVILIESPFLLKFKTLCQKIGVSLDFGEKYLKILKNKNSPTPKIKESLNPKPKIEFRPKKISFTEISSLIKNPYAIYAKKILQLKELEKIDFESSVKEFGSFVHKALEEFIKNSENRDFEKIFEKYFLSHEAKMIWLPKFENIFSEFVKENEQFSGFKNYVEIPAKLKIGEVLLSGKIDRAIVDKQGFVEIFDYKTGQTSTKKDVETGIDCQLTLAALALIEDFSSEEKICSLNYWKLSSSSSGKIIKICKNNQEIQILINAAKQGLSRLFDYFANEENGYVNNSNDQKNYYWHLARIEK
jgi:ATP-dependent helicase/nuclease subunit B